MRRLIICLVLISSPAMAQQTRCSQTGVYWNCDTRQEPSAPQRQMPAYMQMMEQSLADQRNQPDAMDSYRAARRQAMCEKAVEDHDAQMAQILCN